MKPNNYSRRNSRSSRKASSGHLDLSDTRCVLYIRASTADQKNSLAAQEHDGRAFAARNGREIAEVFIDPGVSGNKPFLKRKEAKAAVEYMKKEGIGTLLVLKLDRAFRNLPDMRSTLDHLMNEGLTLRVINPDIDFKGSIGLLIANVLGAIAEFELGCRGERQRDGIDVMRRKRVSRSQYAPFGWDLGPEFEGEKSHAGRPLRTLIPNETEQSALREIIALYERRETLQSIADNMNAAGIPTKRAGLSIVRNGRTIPCSGLWKPQTVKSVIDYAELA